MLKEGILKNTTAIKSVLSGFLTTADAGINGCSEN